MQTIDFRKFIYFSKNTMGKAGKPIFINPELLPDYTSHISLKNEAGQIVSKKIINDLRAVADGHKSGSALRKRGYFYMDFSYFGKYAVRLYYRIFQDKANGSIREPGVYIYDLKPNLSQEISEEGFYEANHHQTSQKWFTNRISESSATITHKEFMVAAFSHEGIYGLKETVKIVNKNRQLNDKTSFNIYFSPGYIMDNDMLWESPQRKKLSKSAGAEELAQIFINSENPWSNAAEAIHTKVFSTSSELVKKSLNITAKSSTKLKKQTFEFIDPTTPPSLLKQLTLQCEAEFHKNSFSSSASINSIKRNSDNAIKPRSPEGKIAKFLNERDSFKTRKLIGKKYTQQNSNFLDLAGELV